MYTSYIGRRLLDLYNQRTGQEITAREFFDAQLFPLFYEHTKYLQWVPNSPFAQDLGKEDKARVLAGADPYALKLTKLHQNVATMPPDASFVIGFPAAGTSGVTSGQVSGVGPRVSAEEMYCSWIGGALGVGVAGGYVLLLDEPTVLWALYEGWQWYRRYLTERPGMRGNQVETWNGRWLTHALTDDYSASNPTFNFAFDDALDTKDGVSSLTTQPWAKLLFRLAERLQNRTTAYVYSLGSTNKTVGFVPLALEEVSSYGKLMAKLFQFSDAVPNRDALFSLYETYYGFARACQLGSLGLQALEPAKLREYLPGGKARAPTAKTATDYFHLQLTELWIIAMLSNNQELYNAADELARRLTSFAGGAKQGKATRERDIDDVLKAGNRRAFIEGLTSILEQEIEHEATFSTLVQHLLTIPVDNFPLFATLVRFRFVARANNGGASA